MNQLNFDLPYYFLFVFIIISFIISWFFYRKDKEENYLSKTTLLILFSVRWLTLSFLSFILMNPKFINSQEIVEKPILLFAQDNSKSIKSNSDSIFYVKSYQDTIDHFLASLSNNYDVQTVAFGDKITYDSSFLFNENSTNFSLLYEHIKNKYHSTNLSDVIISSDGIVNRGKDLSYLSLSPNINFNTLLIGDTIEYDDLIIKSIKNNKYALLKNQFPIEVAIFSNRNFKNIEIQLIHKSKVLQNKVIKNIQKGFSKYTFIEQADQKGKKDYTVVVKSKKTEKNILNNKGQTSVEVIDYSQRILILASCVHPDIGTLNWALEDQMKSKVTTIIFDTKQQVNIKEYDLIIFYKPNQKQELVNLVKKTRELTIPSLSILGNNLDYNSVNNSIFGLGPNIFKGKNEVSASLNSKFKSFNLDLNWENTIDNYPPLSIPFSTNYQLIANANILLYQTINSIKMKYPLLYFYSHQNTHHATLLGEGIWRWKMHEFSLKNKAPVLKNFIKKIIQYLKKTEAKKRLNVDISNKSFIDQPLYVIAEYYNELMEVNTDVELIMNYTNSNGDQFSKKMVTNNQYYELNVDGLDLGDYEYEISVIATENKINKKGSFSIINSQREQNNIVANHQKMRSLNQNGKSHYLKDLNLLMNQLKLSASKKSKTHLESDEKPLINNKWYAIFLILPFLEWGIRKSKGLK
ncbi:MAG: hypothetical protein CL827_06980 [Crocinitomicaceae bacterium]|nr:hypothetical protein [Crocinitomicaceae bacterium]